MSKHAQIDRTITRLQNGGVVKMLFHDLHWFLTVIENYKLSLDLDFNIRISGEEIILTGIKNE